MIYFKWFFQFWLALLPEVLCYATNWFVCLFVRYEDRTDRVKRMGNAQVAMKRAYPSKFFTLWNTHDNALDEYWYGVFGDEKWTESEYQASWWKQYSSFVKWLYRNNAYGWMYKFFSQPVEPLLWMRTTGIKGEGFWYLLQVYKHSFQLEAHLPIGSRYFSVNIGWKAHKGFPRKMFANRIPPSGVRKYKKEE